MLASDACWLGRKLGALGTLAPLVSSNGNLWPMLKAALGEDLCRVGFPDPPAWFVEEERERTTRADAGKRQRRRQADDHQQRNEA